MPIDLNDRRELQKQDPKGMISLVEGFPDQCRTAVEIARSVAPPKLEHRPGCVMLTGLGGSAAGGDFVQALFDHAGAAPFAVNRDYTVPRYVGVGDLVFCASYSGNTEETISSYLAAKASGARIVAVTSGGKLRELAEDAGDTVYLVPGGQPPRTALGFMLMPVLVVCEQLELLPKLDFDEAFAELDRVCGSSKPEIEDCRAKRIAMDLHGAVGVIYGLGIWQGLIAGRWKGQLNENAKVLALANRYPELDHNEILGWLGAAGQGVERYVGVLLKGGDESPKMLARAEVTEKLLDPVVKFHHVTALGTGLLAKLLSLAYLGDFVSLYLAFLNGVDPEDISSIDTLKRELAKVN